MLVGMASTLSGHGNYAALNTELDKMVYRVPNTYREPDRILDKIGVLRINRGRHYLRRFLGGS